MISVRSASKSLTLIFWTSVDVPSAMLWISFSRNESAYACQSLMSVALTEPTRR